jgi:hypothetical protein
MLVCPRVGDLNTAGPFPDARPAIPASPRIFLPFGGFSFPPDQQSTRFGAGKLTFRNSPISWRSPIIGAIASPRLRIMAPGLLLLRRLALPQTSWNQLNFPSNPNSCQSDSKLLELETKRVVTHATLAW